MALDDVKESDYVLEDESGITIVADENLFEKTGDISIDYTGMGFKIDSEIKLADEGTSCGSCSDGGGTACPGKV